MAARRPRAKRTTRAKQGNDKHRVVLCLHANPAEGRRLRKNAKPEDGIFSKVSGKGGRTQLFAFSWADLGALLGCEPEQAQRLARPLYKYKYVKERAEGKVRYVQKERVFVRKALFDPRDLKSILKYAQILESQSDVAIAVDMSGLRLLSDVAD